MGWMKYNFMIGRFRIIMANMYSLFRKYVLEKQVVSLVVITSVSWAQYPIPAPDSRFLLRETWKMAVIRLK